MKHTGVIQGLGKGFPTDTTQFQQKGTASRGVEGRAATPRRRGYRRLAFRPARRVVGVALVLGRGFAVGEPVDVVLALAFG